MSLYAAGVVVLAGLAVVLAVGVLLLVLRRRTNDGEARSREMLLFQSQIESLRGQFAESLERNLGDMARRLDERLKIVGEVQNKLGTLEEASRRMIDIGRDISTLQDILRAPKVRGGVGELLLENLLAQILPPEHYRTQYAFKKGEKVDAVIRIGERLVGIDAKFPLENFRRLAAAASDAERRASRRAFAADVKRHVEDIAGKYIAPGEGTYDFALMYVPAENVYYEIISGDEETPLLEYAAGRKVIPVSPTSFYAYLQVIAMGLKGLHVEEKAREIMVSLSSLRLEMERYREDFRKVGAHLRNAASAFETADKKFERVSSILERIDLPETGGGK